MSTSGLIVAMRVKMLCTGEVVRVCSQIWRRIAGSASAWTKSLATISSKPGWPPVTGSRPKNVKTLFWVEDSDNHRGRRLDEWRAHARYLATQEPKS